MENFKKVVVPMGGLKITIEYTNNELSITGNANRERGQLIENLWDLYYYNEVTTPKWKELEHWNPDWTTDMVYKLAMIWEEYHLNSMNAGNDEQLSVLGEAYKKGITLSSFTAKASYLHKQGVYGYGTSWHKKEVPKEVLEWLKNLPSL